MNIQETGAVLAKAAGFDNRTIGEANVLAWHEVLGDLHVGDCLAAVSQHHRESTEYLMPAHIRILATKIRQQRQELERAQEQRRELEAYAAAGGPLIDRSDEIQQFVRGAYNALPDGDVETLHPRREYWRREHEAFQRQLTAEPNPHFDPAMEPVATWEASKHPAPGPWWTDEAKREASAREMLAAANRLGRRGSR